MAFPAWVTTVPTPPPHPHLPVTTVSLFPEPCSAWYPPLPEVPVEDAVGEAFPADADALQHTVAAQLVHDQGVVYHPCGRREGRGVCGESMGLRAEGSGF